MIWHILACTKGRAWRRVGLDNNNLKKGADSLPRAMPQMFLPGMPDGAIRINSAVSLLSKEGHVTWFVGDDNYFSHPADDSASHHLALATLMDNGHAKPCQITATLGTPRSSLMRWRRQLEERGSGSFYQPRAVRGGTVITAEKSAECSRLLEAGKTIPQAARPPTSPNPPCAKPLAPDALLKARPPLPIPPSPTTAPSTKSQRSQQDAAAAQGIGTACTRADERTAAAIGLAGGAATRFESGTDIALGGVLCGLPALCANGLFTGLERHLSLPKGYYTAMHILCVLGFMALARIRRPEQLRHQPPGELGKACRSGPRSGSAHPAGKNRPPRHHRQPRRMDARSLRRLDETRPRPRPATFTLTATCASITAAMPCCPAATSRARDSACAAPPTTGSTTRWAAHFLSVSKAVTEGLAAVLLEEIIPELLATVPGQPTAEQLAADPLLHRFVVVFDREGSHHSLLSQLWEQRIGAITYRKNVTDAWPESEFIATEVPCPGGGSPPCVSPLGRPKSPPATLAPVPVTEVRRLTHSGHQTAIITTARHLSSPAIAGRMFSRWCQENYFGYMMQHYDIDGLIQYGSEEMDGTTRIVNPAWRDLDKQITRLTTQLRKHQARLGAAAPPDPDDSNNIQHRATLHETIQNLHDRAR